MLSHVQLFCDPMDCSLPGSSVHGISQAKILKWVAISFSRWSSQPRDWTCISCIVGRFFTTEPLGKPFYRYMCICICVYVYMCILFFNWKKTALQCCVGFCHTKNVIQPQLYIYHLLPKPPPLTLSSSSRSLERARPGSLSLAEGAAPTSYFTNDCVYILEKAMAPHSSALAWKIPWMEEPCRLQSMGSLRVRHDWATSLSLFTFMHWRRKWQPTPVLLPGESQGWGSLVGCRLWGCTELDTTEVT